MALLRFTIQGAVPNTTENRSKLQVLRPYLLQLKDACVIINEGESNEESITRFTYHICHHDTGEVCENEQDI